MFKLRLCIYRCISTITLLVMCIEPSITGVLHSRRAIIIIIIIACMSLKSEEYIHNLSSWWPNLVSVLWIPQVIPPTNRTWYTFSVTFIHESIVCLGSNVNITSCHGMFTLPQWRQLLVIQQEQNLVQAFLKAFLNGKFHSSIIPIFSTVFCVCVCTVSGFPWSQKQFQSNLKSDNLLYF